MMFMDAFSPSAPDWTYTASHSFNFSCPACSALPQNALRVWINRYAPVMSEDYRRKWQEFYECECTKVWWAWSTDRPPSPLIESETTNPVLQLDDE